MFGFINKLVKTGMELVETPIAIVKDIATMGGALTDQDKPYTLQKLEDAGEAYDEAKAELDK
jgi:hypothetical protein